jgi:molybdopterin-containing oxidoreductase family iron-sulfur binding subunit
MPVDRRHFVRLGGLAALGLAGGGAAAVGVPRQEAPGGDAATARFAGQATAPMTARRWALAIDVKACLRDQGCDDCATACHRVHNVPAFTSRKDEVKWIWKEPFTEALPDLQQDHLPAALAEGRVPVLCNHCDVPACTKVCPTQATWKRDDGVVMMDWHRCIGCRYCMAACPYGSRSFNWRDPRPAVARVDPAFPTRARGVVEKCNLCEERLAQGRPPACVEACSKVKALVFGDLEDAESDIRRVLAQRVAVRRRPSLGTQPQVYYLL